MYIYIDIDRHTYIHIHTYIHTCIHHMLPHPPPTPFPLNPHVSKHVVGADCVLETGLVEAWTFLGGSHMIMDIGMGYSHSVNGVV